MKVQFEKSFDLGAPAAAAWALLQDLEAVAACMPGARVTEKLDERRVKGTVTVKMGPASLVFRGEVEVKDVDPEGRSLFLVGRGTDTTGTSGAAMDLRAHIEEAGPAACRLLGTSEVSVSGKAATFGGRLLTAVADQVLQQFAANFAERLQAVAVPPGPQAATQPALVPPGAQAATQPASVAEQGLVAAQPAEPVPQAPPPARQLNGLALLWAVFRDRLHHLFHARRA